MYQWLLSIAVKVNWNKTYLKYQPNEDNRNIKVKQMTTENRKEFWSSFSMANSALQRWGHVLYIVQVVFQLKEDEQRFTAEIKRSNRSQNKTKVLFNNSFAFCPQITRPHSRNKSISIIAFMSVLLSIEDFPVFQPI